MEGAEKVIDNDPAMLRAAIECCIISAGFIVFMFVVEWIKNRREK